MGFLIRKLLMKAAKVEPSDIITQTNVHDFISIIKGLIL